MLLQLITRWYQKWIFIQYPSSFEQFSLKQIEKLTELYKKKSINLSSKKRKLKLQYDFLQNIELLLNYNLIFKISIYIKTWLTLSLSDLILRFIDWRIFVILGKSCVSW